MRRITAALALLALVANTASAYPTLHGVYGPPTPFTAPVLNNVAINFGALTQAGQGGVSLASRDVFTYGFSFSGLDLWNGNTAHRPVSWTITDTTATAGYTPGAHWELDAATSCKSTATTISLGPPTPRPCAAGVTAQLNKGPYTFSVTATDATGHTSAPATLTVNIVANTANMGDQAADGPGTAVPAGWKTGSMPVGATIALSTGANWIATGRRMDFQNLDFTLGAAHQVTFTWADPARPGGIWTTEINNTKNFAMNGLTLTGPGSPPNADTLKLYGGSSNILLQDVAIIKNLAAVQRSDSDAGLSIKGATNVTVNNFVGRWIPHCVYVAGTAAAPVSNVTFNNTHCRYISVNFITLSNADHIDFEDTYLMSPTRKDLTHADSFQISNAATITDITVNHLLYLQADGEATSQGPMFGGRHGINNGYIDNGTPGVAGNTLHTTAPDSVVSNNGESIGNGGITGTTLVSTTDALGVQVAPGTITTSGTCSSTAAGKTCTVSGAPQLVGSASNPVRFYTAPFKNITFNGIIYTGTEINGFTAQGLTGVSALQNFTYIKDNGYLNGAALAASLFDGNVVSTVYGGKTYNILTVETPPTGNSLGVGTGVQITWPTAAGAPCNAIATYSYPVTCSNSPITVSTQVVAGFTPTGTGGVGTYQAGTSPLQPVGAGTHMASRFDFIASLGPTGRITYADDPVFFGGTLTFASGFFWDAFSFINSAGAIIPTPGNVTGANTVVLGNLKGIGYDAMHTYAATVFNNGDPQYTLSLIAPAHWAAMTDAQVVAEYVTYLKPKTGGPLDAGGGVSWGALTFDGHWNDGSGKTP